MKDTMMNKINAMLAMGITADEIAAAAKEAEKAKSEAHNKILEQARANVATAFDAYNRILGYPKIPQEVWDEVFDTYETDDINEQIAKAKDYIEISVNDLLKFLFDDTEEEKSTDKVEENDLSKVLKKYIN